MMPWPATFLTQFPLPKGVVVHPARPWWRRTGSFWTRSDGIWAAAPLATGAMMTDESMLSRVLGDLADRDAAAPLPHPGHRAGQVWADEEGFHVLVVAVARSVADHADVGPRIAGPGGRSPLPEWAYPFLVHDPICPWLAPWTPAAVVPLAVAQTPFDQECEALRKRFARARMITHGMLTQAGDYTDEHVKKLVRDGHWRAWDRTLDHLGHFVNISRLPAPDGELGPAFADGEIVDEADIISGWEPVARPEAS